MTISQMAPGHAPREETAPPPSVQLRRLIDGYQASQALYVIATLGIADLLAAGPRQSDDLAEYVEVDPSALYRILRALASVGVLYESEGRQFSLTPVGDCLRSDTREPLGAWAAFAGHPTHWQAWAHLIDAVRTGEVAFNHAFGCSGWEYRAHHPHERMLFDRAMVDLTRRSSAQILDAYDFGRHTTITDVGGGRGALLAAILRKWPATHGILFDLPQVVAESAAVFNAAGVADRSRVVGASFFDGVPAGADVYVLKTVLHDWDDAHALRILQACRAASRSGGALVIVEWDLGPRNAAPDGKFSDLEMLVGTGGRVRSTDQHAALLERSGFHLERSARTPLGYGVLEALAV